MSLSTCTRQAFPRMCGYARRYGRRCLSSPQADFYDELFENLVESKKVIPCFRSQPLGSPLPFDEHACSASLPTWCSVVGYEESDEKVVSAMNCGYPRFVYHPYVLQLMQLISDKFSRGKNEDCLVLPTMEAALRCQMFLQQSLENSPSLVDNSVLGRSDYYRQSVEVAGNDGKSSSKIRVESLEEAGVYAVLFPAKNSAVTEAKSYWQHTGEIVSSRRAELALATLGQHCSERITCCPVDGTPTIYHSSCEALRNSDSCNPQDAAASSSLTYSQLKERISGWTDAPTENIFLLPSGMASIYKTLRSSRRYQMEKSNKMTLGGKSIVFGFPYVDTLKLCSRREFSPSGNELFGKADATDLHKLEELLKRNQRMGSTGNRWSALFTEIPSNPLLQCPDLERLRYFADKYDFCFVVDDTIGNFLNLDLIESGLADAVCTSLTKLFSGRGDAMAGSVICNPNTVKGRWMKEDMIKDIDLHGGLFEADAHAVLYNSADFQERNEIVNETSEKLADFLNDHLDIETVWYPKFGPQQQLYSKYMRGKHGCGYGGVISIQLNRSNVCPRAFYDSLDVAKGPSLGTDFTLVCPYTLLAHYFELDFASRYNVPPDLIRIAVGLEDYDDLKDKFKLALDMSRLNPELTVVPTSR